MSQKTLDQFVDEIFIHDTVVQDQLKATDSLDNFADLMVSLGNELGYSFTPDDVRALVNREIDKQKETLDDEGKGLLDHAMATNWKGGLFVKTGILNLKGEDVLPLYP